MWRGLLKHFCDLSVVRCELSVVALFRPRAERGGRGLGRGDLRSRLGQTDRVQRTKDLGQRRDAVGTGGDSTTDNGQRTTDKWAIEQIDLKMVRLPLVRPFQTSSSRKAHLDHILV